MPVHSVNSLFMEILQKWTPEMISEEFAKCYTQRTSATANSPYLNIWSAADETAYKDLARKTLDELRRWLNFAWKNVTYV